MKKSNQDSYCVVQDVGGVKGLWTFGVMDGHGVNGHFASGFCKQVIPSILSELIEGYSKSDLSLMNNKVVNINKMKNSKKTSQKQIGEGLGVTGFLPNITGRQFNTMQ